ncbi:uncharacterized protein LOC132314295 [Cornus florida]|uniref:uncharacterized protein LOC132314295 n=1 Tax=Cornus florida TaxID=4283 RepID=UPI0028A01DA1|nr:uncharacterized protein LOC132314295 [Cornus florida]
MASSSRFFPLSGSNSSSSSSSSSLLDNVIDSMIQCNQDAFREILNSVKPEIVEQVFKPRKRRYIHRDREGSHRQLMKDYFDENCTYPPEYFHRRFRMRRELFLRILNDVKAYDDYFIQKRDATGRLGLSSIQKMTTAICILAYGCAADHCDEYIKIGENTAIETLMTFCKAVIGVYGEEYMRPPNEADIARLLQEGEERGFPVTGQIPPVNFVVNGHYHTMGSYLSDGIYPKWATLMQTIPHPTTANEQLFAQRQEACRKDVERVFGVLQSKWAITKGPVRFWDKGDLCLIMKMCIILHNMIIEDECHANVRR